MQGFPKHYTKAESLHLLKKNEKKLLIKVPKLIYFTKKAYLDNPDNTFNKIKTIFKKKKNNNKIILVIRRWPQSISCRKI